MKLLSETIHVKIRGEGEQVGQRRNKGNSIKENLVGSILCSDRTFYGCKPGPELENL